MASMSIDLNRSVQCDTKESEIHQIQDVLLYVMAKSGVTSAI